MHAEDKEIDKQMGMRVGYTILVLLGVMIALIIAANFIA
jgi:hypothetical protein